MCPFFYWIRDLQLSNNGKIFFNHFLNIIPEVFHLRSFWNRSSNIETLNFIGNASLPFWNYTKHSILRPEVFAKLQKVGHFNMICKNFYTQLKFRFHKLHTLHIKRGWNIATYDHHRAIKWLVFRNNVHYFRMDYNFPLFQYSKKD